MIAGHRNRKIYGARLLREGWASRVLMSTENPGYIARVLEQEAGSTWQPGNAVWRQVHAASKLPQPASGYFFVDLDSERWLVEPIPIGWFGTLSEVKALSGWLMRHPAIGSLLIVSSATHLRRIRMCCERFIPKRCRVRMIAVPTDQAQLGATLPRERTGLSRILAEWVKVVLYWLVLPFHKRPSESPQELAADRSG